MWVRSVRRLSVVLCMFLVSCGSDSATVGGPDPITASGSLSITGSGAAQITATGQVNPKVGAEIINASNPYTLKFDDTDLAVNILYTEQAPSMQVYQLSISSFSVSNSGGVAASSFEVVSNGVPITGVVVDKANKSITFNQVVLSDANGGTTSITVSGTLRVL